MTSRDSATLQQVRKTVEQLRIEAQAERQPISQVSANLVKYCQEHRNDDALINGFPNDKANPFRPRSTFPCTLI